MHTRRAGLVSSQRASLDRAAGPRPRSRLKDSRLLQLLELSSSSSSSSSPSWHRCGLELVDRLDVRRLHPAVVWEVWVVHAAGQWSVGHSVAAGQLDGDAENAGLEKAGLELNGHSLHGLKSNRLNYAYVVSENCTTDYEVTV